jgi:two-component sensor histidine kinase
MKLNLRQRLLLLTALAVLPAFIIVAFNHYASRAARGAEVDTYTLRMTDIVLNEVVRGLTAAATLMIAMGRSAIIQGEDAEACEEYTSSIQRDLITITDIAVADRGGVLYCHSGTSERSAMQKSITDLAAVDAQSLVVGDYTATPGGAVLPIGIAQRGANGTVQGYIQLFVNMSELVRLVTAATANLEDSRAVVTDRKGTVLLSLPSNLAPAGEALPDYMAGFLGETEPGTLRFTTPDGDRRIVGYRPATERVPIGTIVSLPEGPMMAGIDRAGLANSVIALTGAVLAFLIAWFVGATFIRRPVQALDALVVARQAGDRKVRSGLDHDGSEFGRLGISIDRLFDTLDERDELQRQTAEQRDLFAREVQHRVKNLLSIIQIVAKQTLARPGASPEIVVFENRIRAIIQANAGLLSQTPYSGTMGDLISGAVTPFVGPEGHRIGTSGPVIYVHAKAGASLAMAFHELATNAMKYGSLSVPGGAVYISWEISEGKFQLNWAEQGGPAVTAPAKSGFGSLLISRVLQAETKGSVVTEFTDEGLRFRLEAPLENIGVQQEEGTELPAASEPGPAVGTIDA